VKEPLSEHARYAYGYSDKKPGWTWWLVHIALVLFVLYNTVTIGP
jgi:hypothetical protein